VLPEPVADPGLGQFSCFKHPDDLDDADQRLDGTWLGMERLRFCADRIVFPGNTASSPTLAWRRNVAILCLMAVVGLFGCDGSKSVSGAPKTPGTTTGNYQVIVTAASGTATTSMTIPLSVQ
jgi:hypothetical protein